MSMIFKPGIGGSYVSTDAFGAFYFTATAGQTVFDVYGTFGFALRNIILLSAFDAIQTPITANYTLSTDGKTITLGTAAAAGDVIQGFGAK